VGYIDSQETHKIAQGRSTVGNLNTYRHQSLQNTCFSEFEH